MKKFKILTVLLCAITLFALIGCSKKTYTVTFETNGGSAVEAVSDAVSAEGGPVADIINAVDFSQIVTEEDEKMAEEENPQPIDEEESAKEFEAVADKLESEITDQF